MEFELGRTYSGYKFLDVVRRSRSLVQYRVQNTIAQRLESLQTLPAAATDDQELRNVFFARCGFAPGCSTRTWFRFTPRCRWKAAW